jgi:hypothetical protein
VALGDQRLASRLLRLVESLTPDPSASFPDAAQKGAALEGTYRFLGNESVTPQQILAPHVEATVARASATETVIVAHDTTEFGFTGHREGLGRITTGGHGFFGHYALAITYDAARCPLGVHGVQPYTRQHAPHPTHHSEQRPLTERESYRWYTLVDEVEAIVAGRVSRLHVMDSEADAYGLLAHLLGRRFVVRAKCDRELVTQEGKRLLSERLAELRGHTFRTIPVAARRASVLKNKKRNPPREAREAKLNWSATPVEIVAPARSPKNLPATLRLNVVHVYEVDAPPGCEPIDWTLLTTEPIRTRAQVEAIIDAYRARWRIEEFFKALKTGCAIEKRQLESLHALLNALAVLTPLAWQLLLLRTLGREEAKVPATRCLRPLQWLLLRRHKDTRLRHRATVREAMLAIAALGGHIRNNGDPGWLVLGRGYEKLLQLEEGARLVGGEM